MHELTMRCRCKWHCQILTAKALVTACDKFEHPGRVERMFQLCRSCDGSAFGVFIAVERIVCQELVQNGETHNKLLSAKFGLCREWSCVSESNFCAEFRICCAVPSVGRAGGRYHVEDHTVCKKAGRYVLMASRKAFSVAQYWSAFTARPCAGKSTSSTLEEARDTVQHVASKWCHRKLTWGVSTPLHRAECFMRNY